MTDIEAPHSARQGEVGATRIPYREQRWAKHYCHVWEERANSPHLDTWLRVSALAYARVDANGHAPLDKGELSHLLSSEGRPDRNVARAIKKAVDRGWLAPGSKVRCLIVPSHAVAYERGAPSWTCPEHGHLGVAA